MALNLFFVGAAGAVAFRYSSPVPLSDVARIDHSLAGRLDRIAASLPPADADIMRAQLRDDAERVAARRPICGCRRTTCAKVCGREPFDADAMRSAMAENRAARENFDQVLHDMIASAAAKMSVVGRTKLADWPAERENARSLR